MTENERLEEGKKVIAHFWREFEPSRKNEDDPYDYYDSEDLDEIVNEEVRSIIESAFWRGWWTSCERIQKSADNFFENLPETMLKG